MSNNRFSDSLAALENSNEYPAAQATPSSTPATAILSEITAKLPAKNKGVTNAYYLSKAVSQGIEREAKRRGITKSKLVDEVMKRVLGVDN